MNIFETVKAARDYAADKPRAEYIVEIETDAGEIAYIVTTKSYCKYGEIEGVKRFIADAVDLGAEKEATKKEKDQKALDAAIAAGTAFRTAEIAAQYQSTLCWARRFTEDEKKQYQDWFKDYGLVGIPSRDGKIYVSSDAISKVIGGRPADGEFCGCSNTAWIITEDEWNQIIEIDKAMTTEKESRAQQNLSDEQADIQHKIDTGYCFYCESYCHGDCGHYTTDHLVKVKRDMALAQSESQYGIHEG